MKRRLYIALAIAGVTGSIAYAALRGAPSAPSATPAAAPARISAEGRVVSYPGAEVTVSSELTGALATLNCTEKSSLRQGEVVAELRADDMRAALAEGEARVADAEARTKLAAIEVRRAHDLQARHFLSQQAADRADQALEAARAQLNSAGAAVQRLKASLAKTTLTAPISGTVIARGANPGEVVSAGKTLCTLADLGRRRIEAEVDEFDAGRIRLGAKVSIIAEGYDGQVWSGHVEEIPDAVIVPRLKPRDPASPTDIRILPVKITLPSDAPLKLGQRVEVSVAGE